MNDNIKYNGIWWLPSKPERRLTGTVSYKKDTGLKLELVGSFSEDPFSRDLQDEIPIILGHLTNGKNCTLTKSLLLNKNLTFPGIAELILEPTELFIGAHFQEVNEIKIFSLSTAFSNLSEWVWIDGFSIRNDPNSKKSVIEYQLPETIEFELNHEFTLKINFLATASGMARVNKEATIKQNVELIISSKEERSFVDFFDIAIKIKRFLSLAVNRDVHILKISGKSSKNMIDLRGNPYYDPIGIFLRYSKIKEESKIDPEDMLFTYRHIGERFSNILQNWLVLYEKFEPVMNLLFSTAYNNEASIENRFLNLAQAIESFHRKKFGGTYMEKEKYMNNVYPLLLQSIPNDISRDFRQSLEKKFEYGYQFSLRKRLRELFKSNGSFINNLFAEPEGLLKKINQTRNYYTHFEDKDAFVKSGTALFYLAEKVKLMLIVSFLFDMGFAKEEITYITTNNENFQTIIKAE
ncbi:hypothetical protein EHQ61_00660 [Leptospira wolffii]|uniref:ApeA N-terminal domain 1-containing protein n=1 Tax=Leptospira wolffii TaxID=409998 RepID=UPI00108335E2|nr:HEPN domain-containing protein [Leptospira wolffii]TGL55257.1 hypothetical protein EHQ61_00660 [Leptospira wolffii]